MYTIRQIKIIANAVVWHKLIRHGIQYFRPLGIFTVTHNGTITGLEFMVLRKWQNIIQLKIPILSGFTRHILTLERSTSVGIGLIKIIRSVFRIIAIGDVGGNFLSFSFKLLLKVKGYIHS